jgi:hypothetical protein
MQDILYEIYCAALGTYKKNIINEHTFKQADMSNAMLTIIANRWQKLFPVHSIVMSGISSMIL